MMTTAADPNPIAVTEPRLRTPMLFWPIAATMVLLDYVTKRMVEARLVHTSRTRYSGTGSGSR